MATTLTILSFEDWYDIYEEEIYIELSRNQELIESWILIQKENLKKDTQNI